jgi:hypothetical protein
VLRVVPLTTGTVSEIHRYWSAEYRAASPSGSLPAFRTLGERGPYPKAPLTPKALDGIVSRASGSPGSASGSRRTRCATPVRRRYSVAERTSRRSARCSATPAPPRRSLR